MRERRCFVQFIHPGGEHRPDAGDMKHWNRGRHQRKFLKRAGRYMCEGSARSHGRCVHDRYVLRQCDYLMLA